MKVAFTADIHLRKTGDYQWRRTMEKIKEEKPEAFLVGGDIDVGEQSYREALMILAEIECPKYLVLGNHDIWVCGQYQDSNEKYSRWIEVAEAEGFQCLELSPHILGKVGFVGNMGWYDYSLRDKQVDIFFPNAMEFYRKKQFPDYQSTGARWMDGVYAKWGKPDEEVADRFINRLERHISSIEDHVETICYVSHHLPLAEMSPKKDMHWNMGNVFGGSSRLGEVAMSHPKVKFILCGHSHTQFDNEIAGVRCINVGSDYHAPRYVTIDV